MAEGIERAQIANPRAVVRPESVERLTPPDRTFWDDARQVDDWTELNEPDLEDAASGLTLDQYRAGLSTATRVAEQHERMAKNAYVLVENLRNIGHRSANYAEGEAKSSGIHVPNRG